MNDKRNYSRIIRFLVDPFQSPAGTGKPHSSNVNHFHCRQVSTVSSQQHPFQRVVVLPYIHNRIHNAAPISPSLTMSDCMCPAQYHKQRISLKVIPRCNNKQANPPLTHTMVSFIALSNKWTLSRAISKMSPHHRTTEQPHTDRLSVSRVSFLLLILESSEKRHLKFIRGTAFITNDHHYDVGMGRLSRLDRTWSHLIALDRMLLLFMFHVASNYGPVVDRCLTDLIVTGSFYTLSFLNAWSRGPVPRSTMGQHFMDWACDLLLFTKHHESSFQCFDLIIVIPGRNYRVHYSSDCPHECNHI